MTMEPMRGKSCWAMIKRMRIFAFLVLITVTVTAPAEVYRSVAPDGSVVFTDKAVEGAEQVPMPQWPEPAPLSVPETATAEQAAPATASYNLIWIEKPTANAHIRAEGEGLEVIVATKPGLRAELGHLVVVLVDGKAQGRGTPVLAQRIFDIERGFHTVSAQILDAEGRILIESKSVKFFYQRPSHFSTAPDYVPSEGPVKAAPRAPRAPIAPRAPNVPSAPIGTTPPAGS